jgi:ribosome-associated toxin RatA of RatAB toxin-antitoxin module
MPTISKSTIVPYTQEQMYDLVNDIRKYSEFIPWCTRSEILQETSDEIHAELTFSSSGMEKSFSTINRLQPHKMIEIRLLQGPFRQLEGFWRFEENSDARGCQVMLDLEFEFSNYFLGLMFGPVFHQVAVSLVDAFKERAKHVYGEIA